MKTIIPQKLIVDLSDGQMVRATLIYRVNDGGNIGQAKSVRVAINETNTNSIIAEAKASAETSEGL